MLRGISNIAFFDPLFLIPNGFSFALFFFCSIFPGNEILKISSKQQFMKIRLEDLKSPVCSSA